MEETNFVQGNVAISGYRNIPVESKVSGGRVGTKGNVNPVDKYSRQRDGKNKGFVQCSAKENGLQKLIRDMPTF